MSAYWCADNEPPVALHEEPAEEDQPVPPLVAPGGSEQGEPTVASESPGAEPGHQPEERDFRVMPRAASRPPRAAVPSRSPRQRRKARGRWLAAAAVAAVATCAAVVTAAQEWRTEAPQTGNATTGHAPRDTGKGSARDVHRQEREAPRARSGRSHVSGGGDSGVQPPAPELAPPPVQAPAAPPPRPRRRRLYPPPPHHPSRRRRSGNLTSPDGQYAGRRPRVGSSRGGTAASRAKQERNAEASCEMHGAALNHRKAASLFSCLER